MGFINVESRSKDIDNILYKKYNYYTDEKNVDKFVVFCII